MDSSEANEPAAEEADAVPSLADILGKLDEEVEDEERQAEAVLNQPLALHVDAQRAAVGGARQAVDQLIWSGGTDLARAVVLLGAGLVVLPLLGRVFGAPEDRSLTYEAHASSLELESRLGAPDPRKLLEELCLGERGLRRRLRPMDSEAIEREVAALEEWYRKANGRMGTLKRRAAWAVLGIAHTHDQAAIRRAFKKKALELHPDKGGDADHFQLLQEMKDVLMLPGPDDREVKRRSSKRSGKTRSEEKEQDKGEPKEAEEEEEAEEELSEDELELRRVTREVRKKEDDDTYSWMDDSQKDRCKLEAGRQRIHRAVVDMWARASKLAADVGRLPTAAAGGEAVRALRDRVDRFAGTELGELEAGDAAGARQLLRTFVRQTSEVLCTAGAIDPTTTVAEVAMKVNRPLLSAAPSPELEEQCSRLLEAIRLLPSTFERFVQPLEARFKASDEEEPVHLRLRMPMGQCLELEMPACATVGDLRQRVPLGGQLKLLVAGVSLEPAEELLSRVLEDGAEVVVEPGSLDAEYPEWMTEREKENPAPALRPGLALRSSSDALQQAAVPAPAQSASHDAGCRCFRCIKKRQFRK